MSFRDLLESFEDRAGGRESTLFLSSPRMAGTYRYLLGIPTNHPNWQELLQRLSANEQVYDNGLIQMYVPFTISPQPGIRPEGDRRLPRWTKPR